MCSIRGKKKSSVFGKSKTDSVFFCLLIRFCCEDYGKLKPVFILLPDFFPVSLFFSVKKLDLRCQLFIFTLLFVLFCFI